jgi:hypothetical protein
MDGYVPRGTILPVSAWMLKNMQDYDRCLEAFSRPLMGLVRFELDREDHLTVLNPNEVESAYRYPDMTAQVEYLATAIEGAVSEELVPELKFLSGYDNAKRQMRRVVDMPDRKLDTLIKLLHQNKGVLSKTKRDLFQELSEEEVERLSEAFRMAFA